MNYANVEGMTTFFVKMCRIVFKDKCHFSGLVVNLTNKCHVKVYFNTMFLKR